MQSAQRTYNPQDRIKTPSCNAKRYTKIERYTKIGGKSKGSVLSVDICVQTSGSIYRKVLRI